MQLAPFDEGQQLKQRRFFSKHEFGLNLGLF